MQIQRKKLSDQIAEQLRSKITDKEYLPGDKLPIETDLAKEFNVSRITIREAVHKLDLMGVLEVRQGSGTYVREITPINYIKTLLPMLSMDHNSLKDIFEVRHIIECKTAEYAALNALENDLQEMKSILKKMSIAIDMGNSVTYNSLDVQFHYLIAKATHNQILVTIQELLSDLIAGSVDVGLTPVNALEHSLVFHRKIYEAIAKKDSISAAGLMNAHLEGGVRYARDLL